MLRKAAILSLLLASLSVGTALADILIGQSAPLTGANADLGIDIREGALAYFKKVNDAGGVGGQKIRLVTLDDRNETKASAENTKALVEKENVVALFGYASSTLSIPAMPMVKEHKVPFFAPFTGADTIRKQNEFVYTIRATYADEIDKIVDFWGSLGTSRVTVLHYDDTVGKQNFETVAKALTRFGKQPVSVAIARNAAVGDAAVKAIIDSDPQIVLTTTLFTPIAEVVRKLKAANKHYLVTSLSFAGASQLAKALRQEAAGISIALTVPTAKQTTIPVIKECTDAWAAAGHSETMSVTAIEACIAAKVLVEAMRKTPKDVSRATLRTALGNLGRIDVGGHVIDFKAGGHHGGKFVDIAVIRQNGELRS